MTNNLIQKRFEKVQAKITEQNLAGAIIISKPNQQYLLGFTSESGNMLYIPGIDQNIKPTLITTPLEEHITKDNVPFSGIEVKTLMKDIDPRTEGALKNKKYWTVSMEDSDVYVPHFVLETGLEKVYTNWLNEHKSEETLNVSLPGQHIQEVITSALQNHQLIRSQWDGHTVVHPFIGFDMYLIEILKEANISKVGIEYNQVKFQMYNRLMSSYKKETQKELKTQDVDEFFLMQRIIKDADELEIMKKTATIGTKGFLAAQESIHELLTENEVQAKAEYVMKLNGSKKPAFDTIVVSGENSAYPHGHATDKKIEKGDLVTVDIGAVWGGYNSDMTRTIFAGHDAPAESLKLFKLVNKAHAIGMSHIKPGVKWGAADVAVRKFFKENDVLQYYNHSLGHGVGVEVHEMPHISSRSLGDKQILQEGMVLTVEPGLYIPGVGGARTEDTVVVTSDGYELLTFCDYTHYD